MAQVGRRKRARYDMSDFEFTGFLAEPMQYDPAKHTANGSIPFISMHIVQSPNRYNPSELANFTLVAWGAMAERIKAMDFRTGDGIWGHATLKEFMPTRGAGEPSETLVTFELNRFLRMTFGAEHQKLATDMAAKDDGK